MRVLIADDEYLARSSLKSMLQELGLGIDLVGEATNGEEIAAMARQSLPEVAFVDIRMPKLNGLEAIRRAREASPQTRWYILTGFPQFDYAQEAIRLGVSGYLLKPVNPEELQKVIREVIEDSRRQKAAHNRQFERELMALSYGLTSLEPDEQDSVIATSHFIGALLALDSSQPEGRKAERQVGFCHRIHEIISDYSEIDNRIALFVLPSGDLATVGAWEPAQSCERRRRVQMYFQKVEQEARNWSQDDLAITVLGPVECHTHRELQNGLDRLHWLSPLRAVCGIGGKLDASILEAQTGILGRQEFASLILNLCHHYHDRSYLNYIQAVQALEKPLTSAVDSPNLLKAVADFLNRSINCPFLSDQPMRHWVQALQQQGEPLLTEAVKDEVRGTDLIAQVTAYVDENFMLNIGIGQIAEQLNITPNYLSALFHRKTGTNFMSYLKKTRMVKAKELLADPNIQIQQVAEKVGYISARHFARLFAEHFGCLPSEYRDSIRGG